MSVSSVKDVAAAIVKLDGVFRYCYAGTEDLVYLAPDLPLDIFETVLDHVEARQGIRKWILRHREAGKPYGYINTGQARRTLQMCRDEGIEVMDA